MQQDDRRPVAFVDVENGLILELERLAALLPGFRRNRGVVGLFVLLGVCTLSKSGQGSQGGQSKQGQRANGTRQL